MSRLGALVLAAVLALLLWPSPAHAHEARTAQIEIDALSAFDARVTVYANERVRVSVIAPAGCVFDPAPLPTGVLRCRDGLAGKVLDVDGLGTQADLVFVRLSGFTGADSSEASVVTAAARRVTLPGASSARGVASRYLRLGIEHVLSGLDHVLFLIALFWQAWSAARGRWRIAGWELARTATAFTVAHSLTLAATVLGALHVPVGIAEACIAWSLVLVALDVGGRERALPGRVARVTLAAAFGLVHGLGFAGALADTRLPGEAQWTALLAFNGGVEVGQVLLFATLVVLMLALRMVRPNDEKVAPRLATLSAYVVGVTGSALFFVRAIAIFRRG